MDDNRSSKRKESKKEFSAGGVVVRQTQAGPEVLLIRPTSGDPDRGLKAFWSFPKGWVGDHGEERSEDAAVREVREEGGVNAKIVEELGDVNYVFVWAGTKIFKTVRFYLMDYVSGSPEDHDFEVAEAKFVPWEEAKQMLVYDTDKHTLEKAAKRLGLH